MKTNAKLLVLATLVVLLGLAAPSVFAQSSETVTIFSAATPVAVGHATLDPGIYMIRIVPESADRNILQVTDVDRTTVFATVIAVPHEIPAAQISHKSTLVFENGSAGSAKSLRTWIAAHTSIGYDIVGAERLPLAVASTEPKSAELVAALH